MPVCPSFREHSTPVDAVGEYLFPGVKVRHVPSHPSIKARQCFGIVKRVRSTGCVVWWEGEKREIAALPGSLQVVGVS